MADGDGVDYSASAIRAAREPPPSAHPGPSPCARWGTEVSAAKVSRCKAVTGPISTKLTVRATPCAWRRVCFQAAWRCEAVRGLRKAQLEALAEEEESIEKAPRQLDIVVE